MFKRKKRLAKVAIIAVVVTFFLQHFQVFTILADVLEESIQQLIGEEQLSDFNESERYGETYEEAVYVPEYVPTEVAPETEEVEYIPTPEEVAAPEAEDTYEGTEDLYEETYVGMYEEEEAYEEIDAMSMAFVADAASFGAALTNPEVEVIELEASFHMTATHTVTRDLTINGNGHTVTYTNAGGTITLGAAPAGTQLHLYNITFTRTAASATMFFTSTAANSNNWHVFIHENVRTGSGVMNLGTARSTILDHGWDIPMTWRGGSNTTGNEPNRTGLINVPNGRVTVTGTGNHLGMHATGTGANHGMQVRNFEMWAGAQLHMTAGGTAGSSIFMMNNGTIDMSEGSYLHIWNVGSRTAEGGTTAPANSHGIYGDITRTTMFGATMHLEATNVSYRSRISHQLEMHGGATITAIGTIRQNFILATGFADGSRTGATHHVEMTGEGTAINVFSNNSSAVNRGSSLLIMGTNSQINVRDGAQINVYSSSTGAAIFMGEGLVFNLYNGGGIKTMSRGSGNALTASLRFRLSGDMTMNIRGGDVVVLSGPGTGVESIRFFGGNNALTLDNEGHLYVRHYGTGEGVYFDSGNSNFATADRFLLHGRYSRVDIWSRTQAAMAWSGAAAIVRIEAGPGTIFVLNGSVGGTGGIIRGGRVRFHMDNPLYVDFRNNGGGRVFATAHTAGNPSEWTVNDTDFAVWPTGNVAGFEGNPIGAWSRINFHVNGTNLSNNVISTNDESFRAEWNRGGTGAQKYGRMSASNAFPIIDELRVPTDADMRILGHATIREGIHGERSAHNGEVFADVVVRNEAGQIVYETEMISGERSVFGEPSRMGLLHAYYAPNGQPEFIPENYTVEITRARRWSGGRNETNMDRFHESPPEYIRTDVERSRDVTPPKPVELDSAFDVLSTFTETIHGTSEYPGATIRVRINEDWVREGGHVKETIVEEDGSWSFDLPQLEGGYLVAIYASDNRGTSDLGGVVRTPSTSNDLGNINPRESYSFNDAVFPQRTYRIAEYTGRLEFTSAPATLQFGQVEIVAEDRLHSPTVDAPLMVTDTRDMRFGRTGWRITAKMDEKLFNSSMNHTLYEALQYVRGNVSTPITDHAITIHNHLETSGEAIEVVNISDNWTQTTGLLLEARVGEIRVGAYQGTVRWALENVVPNE